MIIIRMIWKEPVNHNQGFVLVTCGACFVLVICGACFVLVICGACFVLVICGACFVSDMWGMFCVSDMWGMFLQQVSVHRKPKYVVKSLPYLPFT